MLTRTISFLRAHKRVIAFLFAFLVVAYSAFRLIHPDNFGRVYDLSDIALTVILIASQVFWFRRSRKFQSTLSTLAALIGTKGVTVRGFTTVGF